jgi:hypothetical protein
LASIAVITKLVESIETVGVPEIAPVAALIVNPVGSVGETLNTTFGVPPDEVTGVNGVATAEVVKVVEAAASVVVKAVETAKVNVLELVAPFASVAVTT